MCNLCWLSWLCWDVTWTHWHETVLEPSWPALQVTLISPAGPETPASGGRTTHQQCQGCGFGAPEEWIFLCFDAGDSQAKELYVPNLCSSLATLLQPLLETVKWAPQSLVTPWNVILVWLSPRAAGSTPPMAWVGFSPGFQAVKRHTLQQLTFNHLFDLVFVQSCL